MLRNLLLLALLCISSLASAVDNSSAFRFWQWWDDGADFDYVSVPPPAGMPNAVLGFDSSTKKPRFYTFGSGFTTPSGVITYTPSSGGVTWTNGVTRTIGTAFQVNSGTGKPHLNYSSTLSATSVLLTTSKIVLTLKQADNSGMSTNVITLDSGELSVGGVASLTNTGSIKLSAVGSAGKWFRIEQAVTNTASATTPTGQEGVE